MDMQIAPQPSPTPRRPARFGGTLLLLVALSLLVGCAANGSRAGDDTVITATPPASIPPDPNAPAATSATTGDALDHPALRPPPDTNPLTGLPVSDPAVLERRPLAVKISNAPDSVRPQAGIAGADLVFEHYVEGDLTRFTALFWTHSPPRTGSIRSARLIDLEIVPMYGALFAYSGASNEIRALIAEAPFAPRAYEGVTTGDPLYFRDPAIDAPHNLFAVPAAVWERAAAEGWNSAPGYAHSMAFAAAPPAPDAGAAIRAAHLTIAYGPDTVEWVYDEAAGHYARRVDGTPHTDAASGEPVTAANVVLIYAHHQDNLDIVESEWQGVKSYSTEIHIYAGRSGPATVFRDGQMVQGFWSRPNADSMLLFWRDEARREPLSLKPGTTWFQVVPLAFDGVLVE